MVISSCHTYHSAGQKNSGANLQIFLHNPATCFCIFFVQSSPSLAWFRSDARIPATPDSPELLNTTF